MHCKGLLAAFTSDILCKKLVPGVMTCAQPSQSISAMFRHHSSFKHAEPATLESNTLPEVRLGKVRPSACIQGHSRFFLGKYQARCLPVLPKFFLLAFHLFSLLHNPTRSFQKMDEQLPGLLQKHAKASLGWRPSLDVASRMKAIANRMEAITSRLEELLLFKKRERTCAALKRRARC